MNLSLWSQIIDNLPIIHGFSSNNIVWKSLFMINLKLRIYIGSINYQRERKRIFFCRCNWRKNIFAVCSLKLGVVDCQLLSHTLETQIKLFFILNTDKLVMFRAPNSISIEINLNLCIRNLSQLINLFVKKQSIWKIFALKIQNAQEKRCHQHYTYTVEDC